jgi:SagB-type dehydrogenase family enzyme
MEKNDMEVNLLKGAVFFNSSTSIDPYSSSTGFRTSSLDYRTLELGNKVRVAEDFLINTRLKRGDAETSNSIQYYFEEHSSTMLSKEGEEAVETSVSLPKSEEANINFTEVIRKRRSVRHFTGDSIHFSYLASIIRLSVGITGSAEVNLMSTDKPIKLNFRATPSGGGLYPIDLYVAVNNVEGLKKGVYRYRPLQDDLVEDNPQVTVEEVLKCISMTEDMLTTSKSNAIFFTVARPWKSMRKYGDRGMRFVFMETGAIAQNINLNSVALGLGTCDCASVYDDEIHRLLGLDGVFSVLTHAVVLGCPS